MLPFTLRDLEQLLAAECGAAGSARELMWSLAPLEWLARRRGQRQLFVGSGMAVSSLLTHIPYLLDFISHLVRHGSPVQAPVILRKAVAFLSRLLAVLGVPGVQARLGGHAAVQQHIARLTAALLSIKQQQAHVIGQHTGQPSDGTGPVSSTAAAPHAAGAGSSSTTPTSNSNSSGGSKGLTLAALLTAIEPHTPGSPGSSATPAASSYMGTAGVRRAG